MPVQPLSVSLTDQIFNLPVPLCTCEVALTIIPSHIQHCKHLHPHLTCSSMLPGHKWEIWHSNIHWIIPTHNITCLHRCGISQLCSHRHLKEHLGTQTASKAKKRLGFKYSPYYFSTNIISFTYINLIDGIAWEWKDIKQLYFKRSYNAC